MKHQSSFISLIVFSVFCFAVNNALAHPHHESEVISSLGLDHMVYALAVIGISFILFGKISK